MLIDRGGVKENCHIQYDEIQKLSPGADCSIPIKI